MIFRSATAGLVLLAFSSPALAQSGSPDPVYAAYMRLYSGEREAAYQDFETLHARNPQSLSPWLGWLFALERRIEADDTLIPSFNRGITEFLEHVEDRYSRSRSDTDALFHLAYGYMLRSLHRLEHERGLLGPARDAARAKGYADAYIKLHPEHGDAYLALGIYNYYVDIAPNFFKFMRVLLFLPSGNRTEGLKQLERAGHDGSLFAPLAENALAEIFAQLESRPADGIRIGERLVQRFPGNAEMRLDLAQAYMHPAVEAYDRAADQYAAVIARSSGATKDQLTWRHQATLGLANLRRSQWRIEDAIAVLDPVIQQNVTDPAWIAPTFLLRRANYRALLNDPDAIADARRVLADKKMGAYKKAADRQIAFIEGRRKTSEAAVYAELIPGNRLVAEHRWDEAAALYERVGASQPDDWQVRYRRAYLDFARGSYDAAARGFQQVAAASAPMPAWLKAQALLNLAYTHDIAGRRAEATKLYKRITDEYENDAAAGAARVGLISPYRRNA